MFSVNFSWTIMVGRCCNVLLIIVLLIGPNIERLHEWKTVFYLKEETHVESHLATLKRVWKEWRVSFTIKLNSARDNLPTYQGYSNCLKLTDIMQVHFFAYYRTRVRSLAMLVSN